MTTDREMIRSIRRLCESALDASLAAEADDLAALRLGVRAAELASRLDLALGGCQFRLVPVERFSVNLASPISAFMLAPEFEQALTACLMRPQGDDVEDLSMMLQHSFRQELSARSPEGPPVVVCPPSLRDFVEQILVEVSSDTVVVAYNDLPEGAEVQEVGTLGEGALLPAGSTVVTSVEGDWTLQSVELEDASLVVKASRALQRAVDRAVAAGAGDIAALELGIEAAMTWLDSIQSGSYGATKTVSMSTGSYEGWHPGGPFSPGAPEPDAWNAHMMLGEFNNVSVRPVWLGEGSADSLNDAGAAESKGALPLTASDDQGWLMEPTDDSNWESPVPVAGDTFWSYTPDISESLTATEDQGWLVPPESTT